MGDKEATHEVMPLGDCRGQWRANLPPRPVQQREKIETTLRLGCDASRKRTSRG
jgi:hypothetical protein